MEYIIVGTAGHVDHGKTLLVKRLTGVDTDRLKEEKERGISIELGFAPLVLPSGQRLGLVDVPGHERFIRQMLAGVGGMDLVMLIVAADEGVMPQTIEHLHIINLLQVKRGILVITKRDLVDEDWLDLVQEEVREAVANTVLAAAPMVAVSAITGEGLPELVRLLEEQAAMTPSKSTAGKVRMPVDRTFSITGFGTVATGTLWSGRIKVGDVLEILPQGQQARVRTLQVHGAQVEEAVAGQRVAVNLAGLNMEEVPRGTWLGSPGTFKPSNRLDLNLHLLETAQRALKHNDRVRLYLGTAEALGRVALLDREEINPGDSAFVQLATEEPVVAVRHDRFVIRSYSPMETIGGGMVIDPQGIRQKRFQPQVLAVMAAKMRGTPEELVSQALDDSKEPLRSLPDLATKAGLNEKETAEALKSLAEKEEIIILPAEGTEYGITANHCAKWTDQMIKLLEQFHRQYPLRQGLPKEELRTRKFPQLNGKVFQALLEYWQEKGYVKIKGTAVALPGFNPVPTGPQQQALELVERKLKEGGFQPPAWPEILPLLSLGAEEAEEVLQYLLRLEIAVKAADDIYFHREFINQAKQLISEHVKKNGGILLGEARDLLNSSRKYVLPLLEYFDQVKFTRRIGDKRVLY
ncbi:MAG: selenocysteine-specific translation elongation factor [Bacillota bacterium]